MQACFTWQ